MRPRFKKGDRVTHHTYGSGTYEAYCCSRFGKISYLILFDNGKEPMWITYEEDVRPIAKWGEVEVEA